MTEQHKNKYNIGYIDYMKQLDEIKKELQRAIGSHKYATSQTMAELYLIQNMLFEIAVLSPKTGKAHEQN